MFSISHKFATPDEFQPPFQANVKETYLGIGEFKNVRLGLHQLKNEMPKVLYQLLDIRHMIVSRFGFKTDFEAGEFGPFEVEFLSDDHATISYEEDNFHFYGELISSYSDLKGHFAVRFKTKKGRFYFYSIFPGHYLIFKFLMEKMRV